MLLVGLFMVSAVSDSPGASKRGVPVKLGVSNRGQVTS